MKPVKKDPPRKPIYVSNPNDPRLKAYKDSLNSYNLAPRWNEQTEKILQKANTVDEAIKATSKNNEEFRREGLKYELGFYIPDFPRKRVSDGFVSSVKFGYKKPVQPVELKKLEKVEIAPKERSMPTSSIKVNRSVNFPKAVTNIKYDTQKGDVIVGISGKDVTMPRKEFDSWVNKPENRKMFDDYRKSKAKK
jgi:hypothetical protein